MYSYASKAYRLRLDDFLSDTELCSLAKVIVDSRAFSKEDAARLIGKLQRYSVPDDREKPEGSS